MDKKIAAENLLNELSSYHGATIRQVISLFTLYIFFSVSSNYNRLSSNCVTSVDEANGGYLYQTCWDGNKERGDTFLYFISILSSDHKFIWR